MMKTGGVLVVANPVSGNGRGQRLLDGVARRGPAVIALSERCGGSDPAGWPVVRTTIDDSWKIEAEAYVKNRGIRTVLAIGGDGTLMQVADLLHRLRGVLGESEMALHLVPVPGGRGNDFSRAFYGYSIEQGEFWDWAGLMIERERRTWTRSSLDLASANGKLFINMASIGYGGRVVENAQNRKAFWSKTSLVYQVEGALALTGGGDGSCDVKVDGLSVYTGPFFGAFIGNGKANGSGLYWTRAARFDDGKIDGIVFPKPSLVEMARTMSAIKSTAEPLPPIPMKHRMLQGIEIDFYFDRPMALELDGDFVGNAMQHGFKCLPRALNTWVLK